MTSDRATEQGYRTILMAPQHKPYDRFIPAPGHGLGFNDLKIIECRELIARLEGKPANVIDFDEGLEIERTVHAMARSFQEIGLGGGEVIALAFSPFTGRRCPEGTDEGRG